MTLHLLYKYTIHVVCICVMQAVLVFDKEDKCF